MYTRAYKHREFTNTGFCLFLYLILKIPSVISKIFSLPNVCLFHHGPPRTFNCRPGLVKLRGLGTHCIFVRHSCGTYLLYCRMLSFVSDFCSRISVADISLAVTINKVFRYCQVLYRRKNGVHLGSLVLWFKHAS